MNESAFREEPLWNFLKIQPKCNDPSNKHIVERSIKHTLLSRCCGQEIMQFKNFEAEKHRYGHHDILGGAARARVHVVCLISLNRIQSQQYVENEERANNEDCQVPQLMLLLILPIEQCVANEDCVEENDKHI